MANGAWNNVALPGPPNGPAYLQAAAQLMGATQNSINSGANAFQNWQNFNYQDAQRNLFQSPQGKAMLSDAINNGNYAPLFQALGQVGGAQTALPLLQGLVNLRGQQGFYNDLSGGGQPQQPVSAGPETSSAASGPANITGRFGSPVQSNGLSATGSDNAGADTIRSLVAGIAQGRGVGDVDQNKIAGIGRALGVSPDDPLDPSQAVMARRLAGQVIGGGAGQNAASPNRGGINPVPQSGNGNQLGDNSENPQGIGASTAMSPQQGAMRRLPPQGRPQQTPVAGDNLESQGGFRQTPLGTLADARKADDEAQRYARAAARPGISAEQAKAALSLADQAQHRAEEIRKQLGQYNTPESNPAVKAQLEQFGEAGKAAGKRIGEVIEGGGKAARDTINTLDVMEASIRRSGGNFATGPGATEALKFKEAVNNLFPGYFKPQEIVDAEAIVKLNAFLASTAAKGLTARPSQLEFKAFMANNPGLSTSPQGSLYLIDILRQEQQQGIKLGQMALDRSNWDNWGSTEQRFYSDKNNQIRIPKQLPDLNAGGAQSGAPPRYRWTPQGLQPL